MNGLGFNSAMVERGFDLGLGFVLAVGTVGLVVGGVAVAVVIGGQVIGLVFDCIAAGFRRVTGRRDWR